MVLLFVKIFKLISQCMEEDSSRPQTGPIVSKNKAIPESFH